MSKRQTFWHTVAAEWVKFTTVRSTLWVLLITGLLVVGIGALVAAAVTASFDDQVGQFQAAFDPTQTSLAGTSLAQIAIGVLGILMVTSEYSTGTMSNTFTATPRRLRNFVAKGVVFAPVVLVSSFAFCLAAFFVGQALFSSKDLGIGIGEPGVLRAVVGAAVYLMMVGLVGIATGLLLRSAAASITALTVTFFVLPILGLVVPSAWRWVLKYLPSNAGNAMMAVRHSPEMLSPVAGFVVLGVYAAVLFIVAGARVVRRDA